MPNPQSSALASLTGCRGLQVPAKPLLCATPFWRQGPRHSGRPSPLRGPWEPRTGGAGESPVVEAKHGKGAKPWAARGQGRRPGWSGRWPLQSRRPGIWTRFLGRPRLQCALQREAQGCPLPHLLHILRLGPVVTNPFPPGREEGMVPAWGWGWGGTALRLKCQVGVCPIGAHTAFWI